VLALSSAAAACSSNQDTPRATTPRATAGTGGSKATTPSGMAGSMAVASGGAGSTATDPTLDPNWEPMVDPRELMGNMDGGAPDASTAPAEPSYFRITKLELRDPHFYLNGTDITDTPFLGTSVNGSLIPNGMSMDYDGDSFADVSIVVAVTPPAAGATSGSARMVDAHCPVANLTTCEAHPSPGLNATWTLEDHDTGTCMEPIAGTASEFAPNGAVADAPCFSTVEERDVTMNVGGIRLDLTSAQIAATYDGMGPSGRLTHGLIRGFVSVAAATAAVLPSYLGLLAGSPLTSFLDMAQADLAQSPNGQDGWWVYLNFEADPVTYTP